MLHRLTPVLVVDKIEDQLTFWVDRVGFHIEVSVPHNERIGFVILKQGDIELMLQSKASVADDVANLASHEFKTALFIEVDELDPLIEKLDGCESVFERRTTFYGADEYGVFDPAGNAITFAQFSVETEEAE